MLCARARTRTLDAKAAEVPLIIADAKDGPSLAAMWHKPGPLSRQLALTRSTANRSLRHVIIDEPELHVNRSILAKLWDAIESAREDCAFIYLTHDIEFTISRRAATKYAINAYMKGPQGEQWEIEPIPDDTGLSEEVITKIAGSRLPVLFIEGDGASLDSALYRRVYDGFTPFRWGRAITSFTLLPVLQSTGRFIG